MYKGGAPEPSGPLVAEDLAEHRQRWGSPALPAEAFASALAGSGLTGRGGAHVPATWKLTAARDAGPGGTVIVNGAEGEPGSAKDAALLQTRPHLVLDGAFASARAIQAAEVVLWVHDSAHLTRACLTAAVRERAPHESVRVRMLLAPDGYVSGEASAVIRAVRGGPALPAHSPDRARPWSAGPAVLVHNAETHARFGMIALGLDPLASSIVTVAESSAPVQFTRRSVVEAGPEDTFASVLAASGAPEPQAVLLGGLGGSWVRWPDLAHLAVQPEVLRARGLSLGAGVLHLLPFGRDGWAESVAIAERLAAESARQCGPCVFGLPSLADALRRAARTRNADVEVERLSGLIAGRGACRHPDGALRMAVSALEVFGT